MPIIECRQHKNWVERLECAECGCHAYRMFERKNPVTGEFRRTMRTPWRERGSNTVIRSEVYK
jgi:hypothetical protein